MELSVIVVSFMQVDSDLLQELRKERLYCIVEELKNTEVTYVHKLQLLTEVSFYSSYSDNFNSLAGFHSVTAKVTLTSCIKDLLFLSSNFTDDTLIRLTHCRCRCSKVKLGVLHPIQQPGSYWDRASALLLVGVKAIQM